MTTWREPQRRRTEKKLSPPERVRLCWMNSFFLLYFECRFRSFCFSLYVEIRKKRFEISFHFGSRKATPKMGVGGRSDCSVLEIRNDFQNGLHRVFFLGIAWHFESEFDNLQAEVFEFWYKLVHILDLEVHAGPWPFCFKLPTSFACSHLLCSTVLWFWR